MTAARTAGAGFVCKDDGITSLKNKFSLIPCYRFSILDCLCTVGMIVFRLKKGRLSGRVWPILFWSRDSSNVVVIPEMFPRRENKETFAEEANVSEQIQ